MPDITERCSSWQASQSTVLSNAPVRIDLPIVPGRRTLKVFNSGHDSTGRITTSHVAIGPGPEVTYASGEIVDPAVSIALQVNDLCEVWAIAQPGEDIVTSELQAGSASGTFSLPSNALADDNVRASGVAAQTLHASQFAISPALESVRALKIGCRGRKSPTPATQTVALVGTTTGTAGNVDTVAAAAVPSDPELFYLAAVSHRNASANVVSVTGLGLTWVAISDVVGNGGDTRLSVWRGVGTPTGASNVVATFSAAATNSVIGVYRYSGANLVDPLGDVVGSKSSSATDYYAGSVNQTALGRVVTFVSARQRTHVPGLGFVEHNEIRTGTGATDAALASSSIQSLVAGPQAYGGSLSGTVGWAAVALVIRPAATVTPMVAVSYLLLGAPGATSKVLSFALTEDEEQVVDITADRAWSFADISGIEVLATVMLSGAAPLEIDQLYLQITEAAPASVRVTVTQVVASSI